MKKLLIAGIVLFQVADADVALMNIYNLSDVEVDIFIENPLADKKTDHAVRSIRVNPNNERTALNIDLTSKISSNSKPSVIKVPRYEYSYSPSGQTSSIDLILDKSVRVVPTSDDNKSLAKRTSLINGNKKQGADWIFDTVTIKTVENKSHYPVQVYSSVKGYEDKVLLYHAQDVQPGKKEHAKIILARGQELIVEMVGKDRRHRRAEYLPTGKSETLEVIIDEKGRPFIHEQRQSLVALHFNDEK